MKTGVFAFIWYIAFYFGVCYNVGRQPKMFNVYAKTLARAGARVFILPF